MIHLSKYVLDALANDISNRVEKPFPEVGGCMVFLMVSSICCLKVGVAFTF